MSVHEISAWQCDVREPFKSVGLVCTCGKGLAGYEGVLIQCGACQQTYLISVMVLKRAESSHPVPSGGDS